MVDKHTVSVATAFRRAVSGPPDADDPVVKFIRRVRPTRAFVVVGAQAVECEVPDLEELGDVIDQGFDPHAPAGPTYWRITASGILLLDDAYSEGHRVVDYQAVSGKRRAG